MPIVLAVLFICVTFTANPAVAQTQTTGGENGSKPATQDQSDTLPWGKSNQKQPTPRRVVYQQPGTLVAQNRLPTQSVMGRPQDNSRVIQASYVTQESDPKSTQSESSTQTDPGNTASPQTANSNPMQTGLLPSVTKVSKTMTQLPNSAGQVWREYDIRPYTSQVTTTNSPQQAILDWILHETGTEMWFNAPMGILNADKNTLRVYHTLEIQNVVSRVVDKFVGSKGRVQIVGLKLMTVGNPNWRVTALSMLQPIQTQSNGVQGWIASKESAAKLFNQLKSRGDFRLQNAGDVRIHDGQKLTLSQLQPRDYYSSIESVLAPYQNQMVSQVRPKLKRIEEGYKLEIGALTALDNRTLETVLKCEVDQVEKFQKVRVDVPVSGGRSQSMDLQVPQLISWRLNERFRWSSDQVLILSCGVVATPEPDGNGAAGLAKIINRSRGRADAVLFIEYKGPAATSLVPNQNPTVANPNTARRDLVPVSPRR